MKIAFFSTQPYDRIFFDQHKAGYPINPLYLETKLNAASVALAKGSDGVCIFVNDQATADVIELLAAEGIRLIALRCAGFNNVDLKAAAEHNVRVVRVPAYSPHAVAEHALAMIMALNRKTHKAYNRIREQNFSLQGLLGFDLYQKTVGVIGTGNIGRIFCSIMKGLGCTVLAFDPYPNADVEAAGIKYMSLQEMLPQCDIVSLHCPLTSQTKYIIDREAISLMKEGVMLINTSRGALINTQAAIKGLKTARIGSLGIDVYEQEETLFFQNLSEEIILDDTIARLMSFPNVLITAHQGFFTREALTQIAETTLSNIQAFMNGDNLINEVRYQSSAAS